MLSGTIETIKRILSEKLPVFGICLGNQLLSLALGANTYKLKYGHRSANQPCIDKRTGKCYITSQNHSFAIDKNSIPDDVEILYENLNDNTVEGIMHKTIPAFSVQFHPEASPGPNDTSFLFDEYIEMIVGRKDSHA